MGIDYSGGMIIGEIGSKLGMPENPDEEDLEFHEWAEENGMDRMSLHYDADDDYCYYGFEVDDIPVEDIDSGWLDLVKAKAKKFEELTGVKAKLIGTQNIW